MKRLKKSTIKKSTIKKSIGKLVKKVDKMSDEQIIDVSKRLQKIIEKTDQFLADIKSKMVRTKKSVRIKK